MEDSSCFDLRPFNVERLIRRRHLYVRIEQKGHEQNHQEQIYSCADTSHGLWATTLVSAPKVTIFGKNATYISTLLALDMSRPFKLALIKVVPSHRIKLYVLAKARPLNAREAMSGSPWPWNVLLMIPIEMATMTESVHVSA